jgi:hypothetical protein
MEIGNYAVKPCPICASEAIYDTEHVVLGSVANPLHWVNLHCIDCGFESQIAQGLKNAVKLWNKRK